MAQLSAQLNGAGPLLYKPDWPQAQRRWVAFWNREATDRPLMDVRAPTGKSLPPLPPPSTWEEKYLNPDYVERQWQRAFDATWYGGDAVPAFEFLMGGYALGCNHRVKFDEETVWHPHMIKSMDEPVNWHPGPNDPWRHKLDRVIQRLLDAGEGKYLVGCTMQVPLNDLIPLLRGTDEFMMDLARKTDWCAQRLAETFPLWVENYEHIRQQIDARQYGSLQGYPGLWHRETIMIAQSDMSCMISSEHFDKVGIAGAGPAR